MTNVNSLKLKEFAVDNFKSGEHGREFSQKRRKYCEKNKKKSVHYEQFFLFLTALSKDLLCRHIKAQLCSGKGLTLSQTTNFRLFQTKRVCRQQF